MRHSSKRVIRGFNSAVIACLCILCFLIGGIVVGIQTMIFLYAPSHRLFIWVYTIFVLVLGVPLVRMFLSALWRGLKQKYVFEEDIFRFRNDEDEQEVRYNHVVKVRLHITFGGFHDPSRRLIAFHCRNREPHIVWHDTFAFSYRATLKVLVELAMRAGLGRIEVSKSNLVEGELRRAAKGLGEVEFDEDKGCYWFRPFKS